MPKYMCIYIYIYIYKYIYIYIYIYICDYYDGLKSPAEWEWEKERLSGRAYQTMENVQPKLLYLGCTVLYCMCENMHKQCPGLYIPTKVM
jgi:hypothetical protein